MSPLMLPLPSERGQKKAVPPISRACCLVVALAMLAACDIGVTTTPPDPPSPSQTRVVRLTLDPDTVAVGDTTLIHVVIEDSLDTQFRYEWDMPVSQLLPVDGSLDGPRIRFVVPPLGGTPGEVLTITSSVKITNDVPGTRSVTHSFAIPVLR